MLVIDVFFAKFFKILFKFNQEFFFGILENN